MLAELRRRRPKEKDMAPGSCRYFIRMVKTSFLILFIVCLCLFFCSNVFSFFFRNHRKEKKIHATIKLGFFYYSAAVYLRLCTFYFQYPHNPLISFSIRAQFEADVLPVHDHGVQCGLPRLVRAPAVADAAVTLLHFTPSTACLHGIQHGAAPLQGAPGYGTVRHDGTMFSTRCTGRCRTARKVNTLKRSKNICDGKSNKVWIVIWLIETCVHSLKENPQFVDLTHPFSQLKVNKFLSNLSSF